jgi:hypothetical protein
VQVASQNVAKHNKFIRENFLHNIGTKGVNSEPDIGKMPIIQPRIPSLKLSFLPNVGISGDTKEYPIPLSILIIKNKVVFSSIFKF